LKPMSSASTLSAPLRLRMPLTPSLLECALLQSVLLSPRPLTSASHPPRFHQSAREGEALVGGSGRSLAQSASRPSRFCRSGSRSF